MEELVLLFEKTPLYLLQGRKNAAALRGQMTHLGLVWREDASEAPPAAGINYSNLFPLSSLLICWNGPLLGISPFARVQRGLQSVSLLRPCMCSVCGPSSHPSHSYIPSFHTNPPTLLFSFFPSDSYYCYFAIITTTTTTTKTWTSNLGAMARPRTCNRSSAITVTRRTMTGSWTKTGSTWTSLPGTPLSLSLLRNPRALLPGPIPQLRWTMWTTTVSPHSRYPHP